MRDKLGQFFCPEKSVCKIDSSDVVTQGKIYKNNGSKKEKFLPEITREREQCEDTKCRHIV